MSCILVVQETHTLSTCTYDLLHSYQYSFWSQISFIFMSVLYLILHFRCQVSSFLALVEASAQGSRM